MSWEKKRIRQLGEKKNSPIGRKKEFANWEKKRIRQLGIKKN
jgi:hypothetical protein